MADDIAVEFGSDPEEIRDLPFNYFSGFPDVIFAENFEGIPTKHVNWSTTDWDYVHQILNAVLLNPFSEKSKQLFARTQDLFRNRCWIMLSLMRMINNHIICGRNCW